MCKTVIILVLCIFIVTLCNSDGDVISGFDKRIGNFSIELLYHTTKAQKDGTNLIMSPITVWTTLALIAEGAAGDTLRQICLALRITPKNKETPKRELQNTLSWLNVETPTVELKKFNALFVDQHHLPLPDFTDTAKQYEAKLISADFSDSNRMASVVNNAISNLTHGRIDNLLNSDDLLNANFVLTSALYFKGQWTVPFNSSSTTMEIFYDSQGKVLGKVNMMYNRHTFRYVDLEELQGRVLELTYGTDNRLSMMIMLPNHGVTLTEMFYNNQKNITVNEVFDKLMSSADEEVDCYIPRFKIETSVELPETLERLGVKDLFDERAARLPSIARWPIFVSKMIHKAEIEVNEEGTIASAVTVTSFANRAHGDIVFHVNRPFIFYIIEKITKTIVFAGVYHTPTLH